MSTIFFFHKKSTTYHMVILKSVLKTDRHHFSNLTQQEYWKSYCIKKKVKLIWSLDSAMILVLLQWKLFRTAARCCWMPGLFHNIHLCMEWSLEARARFHFPVDILCSNQSMQLCNAPRRPRNLRFIFCSIGLVLALLLLIACWRGLSHCRRLPFC